MNRTWCTQSYVTRGAQVLSHQNLHTYITLHYSTVHHITLHYSTLHYIHEQDLVHTIVCHQRGTSPKSSEPTYLHYITVQYSTSHYITLQYITLQWSVRRLSLRFYSLTPTFVKYDGSTNRKWHRSLWIWLQQVWQRWWAGHFDSIIWIACHFSEDVSTYQEYVAMYQEHVWTHLKKLLQRISTVWQVTVRRGDTCIRKVVQFT